MRIARDFRWRPWQLSARRESAACSEIPLRSAQHARLFAGSAPHGVEERQVPVHPSHAVVSNLPKQCRKRLESFQRRGGGHRLGRAMAGLSFDIDSVIAGRARLSDAQALELYQRASLHDLGTWAQAVT